MQLVFCPKCGNPAREGDKFCRKCGTPLKAAVAPAGSEAAPARSNANIPSYNEVAERFNKANNTKDEALHNPDGTVLLGEASINPDHGSCVKQAQIILSLGEVLSGCSKVVDFGTGKRYEILIPSGLSPGDKIVVKNTGIVDPAAGIPCDIELTVMIG